MNPLIIGFGHKVQRGKDLCCAYAKEIIEQFDYEENIKAQKTSHPVHVCKYSFAEPLKEGIGRMVFGLTDAQLHGEDKTKIDECWGMTPRDILQKAGTDCMRNMFGNDIWVKAATKFMERCDMIDILLINDVRFTNEAQFIKDRGGYVIKVYRDIPSTTADLHESETALDDYKAWDFLIDNNGSKIDLFEKLSNILLHILQVYKNILRISHDEE